MAARWGGSIRMHPRDRHPLRLIWRPRYPMKATWQPPQRLSPWQSTDGAWCAPFVLLIRRISEVIPSFDLSQCGKSIGLPHPHGALEGLAHLGRLAEMKLKAVHPPPQQGMVAKFFQPDALRVELARQVGRLDACGRRGIANDAFGLPARLDRIELGKEALTHHADADVAAAQVLARAVSDHALAHPGDDVLVDDVARDPAPAFVLDGAAPTRAPVLDEGLAPLRHAHEEPRDAERILVVDRHPPFEMAAEIESVRPQRDPPDRPIAVLLALPFAHAPVDEAVVEFLEFQLEVLRRRFGRPLGRSIGRTAIVALPFAPIVMHPFEVDRIAG